MEKEITVNAKNLDEARFKIQTKIPKGFFPVYLEETPSRNEYKFCYGETEEEAKQNAVRELSSNNIKIEESGEKKVRDIISYASNPEDAVNIDYIKNANPTIQLDPEFRVEEVKCVKKGEKESFFSSKRNYHTYQLKVVERAYAKVSYSAETIIKAKITDDEAVANNKFLEFAKSGNKNLIEIFLSKGIDINVSDSQGKTALFYATENGHIETALFLIHKGIDIFKQDINGNNVLCYDNIGTRDSSLSGVLINKGLDKPVFLYKDYCPNCKKRVETYEDESPYDDGWFSRVKLICKECHTVLSQVTKQN